MKIPKELILASIERRQISIRTVRWTRDAIVRQLNGMIQQLYKQIRFEKSQLK